VFKGPVLPIALLLAAPTLYSAFVTGSISVTTGLVRFLIALVVAAIMLGFLRSVTDSYRRAALTKALDEIKQARESGDTPAR
jgi:hypothetical protein